jgi:predicted dienelactone hydrolase
MITKQILRNPILRNVCLPLLLGGTAACAPPALYNGSYPVYYDIVEPIEVAHPERDEPLSLRAFVPRGRGPFPLIVLSHGTFSSNERYDRVAEFWAGQGYIVMLPQHIDANYGVTPKGFEDMLRIVETRVVDMRVTLDRLPDIEAAVPQMKGKIMAGEYIAAGHSIGTLIAMRVTGLEIHDVNTDRTIRNDESRYKLLVLLSDPGKMRQMPETAWTGSTVPTFLCTGTEDYGLMGAREAPQNPNRILSSNDAVDRYQVLLRDGDHYFGGLVQKDVDTEPDHEGLEIFNRTSTAFMNAYIKGDAGASEYLRQVDMRAVTQGRAELIRVPAAR